MRENEVAIVLPLEGYTSVARLVAGGFLSRCEFDFEAIDDIQLALDLALRSLRMEGPRVTVRLAVDGRGLTVAVGALAAGSDEHALSEVVRDGIELGAVLEHLVDRVELRSDGGSTTLLLCKEHESGE